jgi:hypothetical protein
LERGDGETDAGGGEPGGQGSPTVADGFVDGAFFEQADGLEGVRGEGGVRAAEPDPQNDLGSVGEPVVEGKAGHEPEQQGTGDVGDERAPGFGTSGSAQNPTW